MTKLAHVLMTVPALQNAINARSMAVLAATSRSMRAATNVVREVDNAFDLRGAPLVQDMTESIRALDKTVRWLVPVLKRISKDLMQDVNFVFDRSFGIVELDFGEDVSVKYDFSRRLRAEVEKGKAMQKLPLNARVELDWDNEEPPRSHVAISIVDAEHRKFKCEISAFKFRFQNDLDNRHKLGLQYTFLDFTWLKGRFARDRLTFVPSVRPNINQHVLFRFEANVPGVYVIRSIMNLLESNVHHNIDALHVQLLGTRDRHSLLRAALTLLAFRAAVQRVVGRRIPTNNRPGYPHRGYEHYIEHILKSHLLLQQMKNSLKPGGSMAMAAIARLKARM